MAVSGSVASISSGVGPVFAPVALIWKIFESTGGGNGRIY